VRPHSRIAAAVALALFAGVAGAGAQILLDTREELARSRPEAWALRWFSAALAPSGFGPAETARSGGVELALDVAGLPRLSREQRTTGFDGTKVEDLNRAPLVARPRALFGLPGGFTVDASWLPPIEFDGARANLLMLGLSRPVLETGSLRLAPRLWLQSGVLEGDFVCPRAAAEAGVDPVANPYGCLTASEDRVDLDQVGLDLALSWSPRARPALAAWLSVSARALDSSFRTDALWSGIEDHSRLDYDGGDWGLGTGLSWRSSGGWRAGAELRWTPLEVIRPATGGGRSSDDSLLQLQASVAYRLR
jgi:hypothetical protein